MRRISKKRQSKIAERQQLRLAHLTEMPYCEASILGICRIQAHDVHEIINRSQRSAAWLEPDLFVSVCRPCHSWITVYPDWARRHGLHLRSSEIDLLERAHEIRGTCRDRDCGEDHLSG